MLQNTIYQLLGRFTSALISTLLVILIARMSDPSALGYYSIVIALVNLAGFMAGSGMMTFVVREISLAPQKTSHFMGNLFALQAAFSIPYFVLLYLMSLLFDYPNDRLWILLLAGLWFIFGIWRNFFAGVFFAQEQMKYEFIVILTTNVLILALAPLALQFTESLIFLFVGLIVSRVVALGVCLFIYLEKLKIPLVFHIDLSYWREILSDCYPYALNNLMAIVYIQADVILLEQLQSTDEVGFYKAATAITVQLPMLIIALNNTFLPRMSRSAGKNSSQFQKLIVSSTRYALLLSLPMCVGLVMLSAPIIEVLYTSEYTPSVVMMSIVALMLPIRFMNNSFGTALTAASQQKWRTFAVFIGASFNISVNFWLISRWGGVGAAVATVLTDLLILVIILVRVVNLVPINKVILSSIRPVIACAIMAFYLFGIRSYGSIWFVIPTGASVYFIALYVIEPSFRVQVSNAWLGGLKSIRLLRSGRL